jgi:hypothetical protein
VGSRMPAGMPMASPLVAAWARLSLVGPSQPAFAPRSSLRMIPSTRADLMTCPSCLEICRITSTLHSCQGRGAVCWKLMAHALRHWPHAACSHV